MTEIPSTSAQARVPFGYVLASAVGLWLCYFALATIRSELLELGFTSEMLWRRAVLTSVGIVATLAIWLVLRLLDHRVLWIRICAALVIAAPVSVGLAQANRLIFAPMDERIQEQAIKEKGINVFRDESGNLLVDVPVPGWTSEPGGEEGDGPYKVKSEDDYTLMQQLSDVALSRYFMLLAWCALYVAMLAAEQARAAERREGEFRRAAKAAELRSLRYQVNPHFLFNTLNSLSALVMTDKKERAEEMIQSLSTFYRHSLVDDATKDVPLADEFDLQRHYLDIEAVRFPDRLRAVFELPETLESACVPGMILQPLIENSVKHAVAPSTGMVTITISAREEYGRLVLTVADDGAGKVQPGAPVRPGHGIGLVNVRQRLEARFGNEASLVSGATASGYATHIRIPLSTSECFP